MKILMSKISDKGQITVPKIIRETLKIRAGDFIKYDVEENTVKIRKLETKENIWLRSIESTLEEWEGDKDNDL